MSILCDSWPAPSVKRGMPVKRGRRLSILDDSTLSEPTIGGYYFGVCTVLTNIFSDRKVLAYITSAEKQTGSHWIQYILMFLSSFRRNQENQEISYYKQKDFWSLYDMIHSRKGIELLVNLINIAYYAMRVHRKSVLHSANISDKGIFVQKMAKKQYDYWYR